MAFDPTVYAQTNDYQREPHLSDEQWTARFIACMVEQGGECAADSFKAELAEYAKSVAPSYLETRKEYVTPEEAAETDISYWEADGD